MHSSSLSGWLDGTTHHFPLRVYYGDTDAAGIVYYANYLDFAERARTEMMRMIGFDHAARAAEDGTYFAVRRCETDYLKSAKLDDLLDVRSKLVHIGGASLQVAQSIWRGDDCLTALAVHLVHIRSIGGVARIPDSLRLLLQDYLT